MQKTTPKIRNIIALDVGERRVGVAIANSLARIPSPLTTLTRDDIFWAELEKLLANEGTDTLVVGLPRNLQGDDTAQTAATRAFMVELKERFKLPVVAQDEALTSRQAEEELRARGKTFAKGDIDALAATYILDDYLGNQKGGMA